MKPDPGVLQRAVKHGLRSIEVLTPDEDPAAYEELRQELKHSFAPVGSVEAELVERIASCFWRLRRCGRIEAGVLLGGEKVINRNLNVGQQTFLEDLRRQRDPDFKEPVENLPFSGLIRRMIFLRGDSYIMNEAPKNWPFPGLTNEDLLETLQEAYKEEKQDNPLTYEVGLAFSDGVSGADVLSKLARYDASLDRALYRAMHELQRLQAARKGANVSAPAALDVNVSLGK
jgi:hypothetical protein